MSLCTVTMTKDMIVIASDTAMSAEINNVKYRISNEGKKLHIIDDYIVFISGDLDLSKIIIDDFKRQEQRTLDNLQKLIKFWFDKYIEARPFAKQRLMNGHVFNLTLIAQYKNGRTKMYEISQQNNFNIQEYKVSGNQYLINSVGVHYKEASKLMSKFISKGKSLFEALCEVYNKLSDEEVGGILEAYIVDKNGIKTFFKKQIKEKKNIRWMKREPYEFTEAIKEQILRHGMIAGSSLVIGENNSVLKMFPNQGLWLGHSEFTEAPFSVDLRGHMKAKSAELIGPAGRVLIDTDTGTLFLNNFNLQGAGKIDAQLIQAGTMTTDSGFINDLTVTRLKTLDKSDQIGQSVDFVEAQDNYISFKTGIITSRIHALTPEGFPLYWTNDSKTKLTTEITPYPFYNLTFEPLEKLKIYLEGQGIESYPIIQLGAGDRITETSGKGYIIKPEGKLDIVYYSSNIGRERRISLDDSGIVIRVEGNGDITIEGRNINFKASQNINFDAQLYNFA